MAADVEMKPVDNPSSKDTKVDENDAQKKEEDDAKPAPPSPAAEIKSNVSFLDRAVATLEPRFTRRVLRTLTALRKRLDDQVLREAISDVCPRGIRATISNLLSLERRPLPNRFLREGCSTLMASRKSSSSRLHGH